MLINGDNHFPPFLPPTVGYMCLSYYYLWSAKLSSPSALSVPAVANMMVVSRSAMIPLTVCAAFIHAWVPRDPLCSVARINET